MLYKMVQCLQNEELERQHGMDHNLDVTELDFVLGLSAMSLLTQENLNILLRGARPWLL